MQGDARAAHLADERVLAADATDDRGLAESDFAESLADLRISNQTQHARIRARRQAGKRDDCGSTWSARRHEGGTQTKLRLDFNSKSKIGRLCLKFNEHRWL
jgi:hypothetical protein